MFVIGTAGHVDHGKSALVKALTGVDPDRLEEEKARGMTIDLGFAELTLPGGRQAGVVDVPGHERFIKNMLAGVGGIDLALLVVAADEGIMPQTREHLAIMDLLAIPRGVVALTKSDLASAEDLEMLALEVAAELEGTALVGAPIVPCSALTGAGLDDLLRTIDRLLDEDGAATGSARNPRLPIDRVFTVAGFGTVVTGTLLDGPLRVGTEVEVLPSLGHGRVVRARVRGLQNHGRQVETAAPGTRTAVNLGSVDVADISRGQVLTTVGWLNPSKVLDVRLRVIESAPHALRHNTMVTFHHYAAETPARAVLLEGDELAPGAEGWAQLRLNQPLAVLTGDRFVVRDAESTIGGGTVVSASQRRATRRAGRLATLDRQLAGGDAETLIEAVRREEPASIPAGSSYEGLDPAAVDAALETLRQAGRVVVVGSGPGRVVYTSEGLARLAEGAVDGIAAYHRQYPMRPGMPREELRSRTKLASRAFDTMLAAFVASGRVEERGPVVAMPGWAPKLTPAAEAESAKYLAALQASPFAPAATPPSNEVLRYLVDSGQVVRLGDGTVFEAGAYGRMVDLTTALIRKQGDASLAEVRDLLGTSRRYVQPFLEHLDQARITARRGDRRVLVGG